MYDGVRDNGLGAWARSRRRCHSRAHGTRASRRIHDDRVAATRRVARRAHARGCGGGALWNSPSFEASLTDLGLARADLVEAHLLRNPILPLLFPAGPKQLERTLQFPLEVLWQRPRRVAAATLNAQAVGERLVYDGLTLVADVQTAFIEAVAGERQIALAAENATLARRIAGIADARLRAGDISELEARTAKSDAAQVDADYRALGYERDVRLLALVARMGLDTSAGQVRLMSAATSPVAACGAPEALVEDAVASRPDVRAAEIAIEAAGRRLSWERSRILTLVAMLDANSRRGAQDELGPGLNGEIRLFARNQGGVSRADAELERAGFAYLALRARGLGGAVRGRAPGAGPGRDAGVGHRPHPVARNQTAPGRGGLPGR